MSGSTTVPGVSGGTLSLSFQGGTNVGLAQQIANALAAASSSHTLDVVAYTGGPLPSIPPGDTSLELVLASSVSGSITVPAAPAGVAEYLVLPGDDPNAITINGNPNLTIIGGGTGPLFINDPNVIDVGSGIGSAGTASATVSAADSPYIVAMGPGFETVVAEGSGTINAGVGANFIDVTGAFDTVVALGTTTVDTASFRTDVSAAADSGPLSVDDTGFLNTVTAGSGTTNVTAAGSSLLTFGGTGSLSFLDTGVHDTLSSGTGNTAVTLAGVDGFVWGSASIGAALTANVTGQFDTVGSSDGPVTATVTGSFDVFATGTSTTSISVSGASDLIYGPGGSGTASINASGSSNLTIGGGSGAETVNAGMGTNLLVWGPTGNFDFIGGSGPATVIGEGASNTISAGAGPLLYAAGSDTPNSSTVTGLGDGGVTLYGAAGGSITYGSSVEGAVFAAFGGNETLSAAGSPEANTFWGGQIASNTVLAAAGSGNDTLIAGSGTDTLQGGSGNDLFAFVKAYINGAASDTITGFTSNDQAGLFNYGTGEAASVLAAATVSGGNTTIALSDGTHVTFAGVTDLTTHNLFSTT